jgi:hypothetical protein
MAETPTLTNLTSLANSTTAINTINSNNAAITTAFLDTLSLSGTSPNQMQSNLDMNNNHVLNLPAPISADEPVRLTDIQTLTAGGSITFNSLPTGGTAGQVLEKNSSSNYDASWLSINQVPTAGAGGQFLGKNSSTNYDISWLNTNVSDIRYYAQSPLNFNTVGTGSDDTSTLQAAINAGVGTIVVPAGIHLTISSSISLLNKSNIRITGSGSGFTGNQSAPSSIKFTGTTGSLFVCDGCSGFELDHLSIYYTSPSFTGDLIDLDSAQAGGILTCFINIHDNFITTVGGKNASSLINVAQSLTVNIERNDLSGAIQLIKGGANSNNIVINNNWFDQATTTTSHVGVYGEGWVISNNVFESTGAATNYNIVCNGIAQGLSITGNTFNDSGTGTPIYLINASCQGVVISGNDIQGGLYSINAGPAFGVSIVGNFCSSNNTSNIIVNSATNVLVAGNTYLNVEPVTLVGAVPSAGNYIIDDGNGAGLLVNSVITAPKTSIPAGGAVGVGYKLSSTNNLGVFFGSGAPTLSAAQGSLYVRTDGSSSSTRLYVNTTGSTTWTNVTTAT